MIRYEFVVPFTVDEDDPRVQGDEADLLFEHLDDLTRGKAGLGAVKINAAHLRPAMTDEDIERLVRASIDRQPNGCCGNDAWRGHLCQYHEGYEDGLNKAQELLGEAKP